LCDSSIDCVSLACSCSEDVLWSALFALAVISRDTSPAYITHLLRLAAAGVLAPLETAMAAYRRRVAEQVRAWSCCVPLPAHGACQS
jgi:hypothetical protein